MPSSSKNPLLAARPDLVTAARQQAARVAPDLVEQLREVPAAPVEKAAEPEPQQPVRTRESRTRAAAPRQATSASTTPSNGMRTQLEDRLAAAQAAQQQAYGVTVAPAPEQEKLVGLYVDVPASLHAALKTRSVQFGIPMRELVALAAARLLDELATA